VVAQEDRKDVTTKTTQTGNNSQRVLLLIGFCKKYVDNAYSKLISNVD
jgi:hypothetical protein